MKKIILDLCGGTGSWSKPYEDAGYETRIITLPIYDVRNYHPPKNVYGILAAPPCDEFSIAKNHKLKRNFESALEIVFACLRIIKDAKPYFYAIENPAGYLQKWLGKPQYSFQPWNFGDPWTKRTYIWGDFSIPKKQYMHWYYVPKIPELYVRPNRSKPSIAFLHKSAMQFIPQLQKFNVNDDASFRAITPPGFAKAFFEANQ